MGAAPPAILRYLADTRLDALKRDRQGATCRSARNARRQDRADGSTIRRWRNISPTPKLELGDRLRLVAA